MYYPQEVFNALVSIFVPSEVVQMVKEQNQPQPNGFYLVQVNYTDKPYGVTVLNDQPIKAYSDAEMEAAQFNYEKESVLVDCLVCYTDGNGEWMTFSHDLMGLLSKKGVSTPFQAQSHRC
jgi:hypothetical protein